MKSTNSSAPTFSQLGPVRPWLSIKGRLCEGPLWNTENRCLYWTDIPAGRVYCHEWDSGITRLIYQGEEVGGFTLQTDGTLLLFQKTSITHLHPNGQIMAVADFSHSGSKRFNDVIADPEGRVFAGTIGNSPTSGGLFRFERDGSWVEVASGTDCSNGLAFSPGGDFLYWVCSTRRTLFRFPYHRATGKLDEAAVFYRAQEGEGIPDGITVDQKGNLYCIFWGASQFGMIVFSPSGSILLRLPIPAVAPTSLCFCGPDLHQLAITSSQEEELRPATDLFLITSTPFPGGKEYRSRINLQTT